MTQFMKTSNYKFWTICMMSFLSLIIWQSCSNSNNSNNETSTDAYIQAVKNDDFVKAQDILDNIYADYLSLYNAKAASRSLEEARNKYWTAVMYIYKAEMQYLLPMNDSEANKRMIYTLQSMSPVGEKPLEGHTYDGDFHHPFGSSPQLNFMVFSNEYNKLCLELIQIALTYDNIDIAEKVSKFVKPGLSWKCIKEEEFEYTYNDESKQEALKLIEDYKPSN